MSRYLIRNVRDNIGDTFCTSYLPVIFFELVSKNKWHLLTYQICRLCFLKNIC